MFNDIWITPVRQNLGDNHENNANREKVLQPQKLLAFSLPMAIKNTIFGLFLIRRIGCKIKALSNRRRQYSHMPLSMYKHTMTAQHH